MNKTKLNEKQIKELDEVKKNVMYSNIHGGRYNADYIESSSDISPEVKLAYFETKDKVKLFKIAKRYNLLDKVNHKLESVFEYFENSKNFYDATIIADCVGLEDKKIEFYNKAITQFEKEQDYYLAGVLSRNICEFQKAVDYFKKDNNTDYALSTAKQGGLEKEIIELSNFYIDLYKKKGKYTHAAEYAHDAKLYKEAMELYAKAGDFGHAAYSAETGKLYDEAIHYYLISPFPISAAEVAEKAKYFDRAIEIYKNNSRFDDAIRVAKENNLDDKLIPLYEGKIDLDIKNREFYNAIKTAKDVGLTDKVQSIYDIAKEHCINHNKYSELYTISKEIGLEELVIKLK